MYHKTAEENTTYKIKQTLQCEQINPGEAYLKERTYKGAESYSEYINKLTGNTCVIDTYIWEYIQSVFDDISGASHDWYGFNSELTDNFAFISAPRPFNESVKRGSVYVYKINGEKLNFSQEIFDISDVSGNNFGIGLSVNHKYNQLFIGAIDDLDNLGNNIGSVSIYDLSGTSLENSQFVFKSKLSDPSGNSFGTSITTYADYLFIGDNGAEVSSQANAGRVSIYRRVGSTWTQVQVLEDPSGGAGMDFGWAVSAYGDYLVVGERFYDPSPLPNNVGCAVIYKNIGGVWTFIQRIIDDNPQANDRLGWYVKIYKNRLFVTALSDVITPTQKGSVFYFELNNSTGLWDYKRKFVSLPGFITNISYGNNIDVNDEYLCIGAPTYVPYGSIREGYVDIYKWDKQKSDYSFFERKFSPIDNNQIDSDQFGYSINLTKTKLLITSRFDSEGGEEQQGSAHFYILENLKEKCYDKNVC